MKVLVRNYRSPFGEIDIIAREGETLVFIEVKTRSVFTAGEPAEAVTPGKQKKIRNSALFFLKSRSLNVHYTEIRFDVAAVTTINGVRYHIQYIPGAFPGEGWY